MKQDIDCGLKMNTTEHDYNDVYWNVNKANQTDKSVKSFDKLPLQFVIGKTCEQN